MMVAFIIFLVVSLGLMFVFPPLAVILFPACVIFLTVVLIVRKRKHRQQQEVPVVIDAVAFTVILDRRQGMDDDKTEQAYQHESNHERLNHEIYLSDARRTAPER